MLMQYLFAVSVLRRGSRTQSLLRARAQPHFAEFEEVTKGQYVSNENSKTEVQRKLQNNN